MNSPQWPSVLRQLWPNVPWQASCKLISRKVPTLCLDSGIISPPQPCFVEGVYVFKCNLPPALLTERPGSFFLPREWDGHRIRVSTQGKSGEENSPTASAGIQAHNFSITSPVLLPTSYPGPALHWWHIQGKQ